MRKDILKQVAKDSKGRLLAGKAEKESSDSTHTLAVSYFFKASRHPIEHIRDIETSGVLVLHAQLHRVEELLHGVVEYTEICPASDHILVDDFGLLIELAARVEVKGQEVLVLKFLRVYLVAILGKEYRLASHY
jgi:hypothetical protein